MPLQFRFHLLALASSFHHDDSLLRARPAIDIVKEEHVPDKYLYECAGGLVCCLFDSSESRRRSSHYSSCCFLAVVLGPMVGFSLLVCRPVCSCQRYHVLYGGTDFASS